jgi:hypothetical protein
MRCIGEEQNNRNSIPTVHISLLIWCSATFCNQYSPPFLKWIRTSFKQSLAECYTIILEDHLQVVSEMFEVGPVLSLVSKTDHSDSTLYKYAECASQMLKLLAFLAFQITIAEQFQLSKLGHCCFGKLCCHSGITSGSWGTSGYPTCLHPPLQ